MERPMSRIPLPFLILLSACVGPTYRGFLKGTLNGEHVSYPDGDIIGGVPTWPSDASVDQVYVPMGLWQPGQQQVTLGGLGSGSATVTVERIRWTGNGSFPFIHEGRIEGTAIDARFEITESNCKKGDTFDDVGCDRGYLFADEFGDGVTFPDVVGASDCPAAIEDEFLGEGEMTVTAHRLTWGQVSIGCARTDRNEVYKEYDENTVFAHVCGADRTMRIDGCSWSLVAVGSPAGDYFVSAGIVDEGCEPQWCTISAAGARSTE